jgi:hypothetical protein
VAGLADEASARAALVGMQERLGRGPHVALGVEPAATADEIRSAFLVLTKQFHPARFGRMDAELQRFANEVFLGIKAAHDVLKASAGPAVGRTTTSPGMPVLPIGGAATASAQTTQTLPRPTALGMQPIPRTPSGVMPTVARTNRTDITKPMPAMPDPNAIRTAERPTQPGIATPAVNGRRLPDPGAKTPPLDLRGGAKVVVGAGSRPLPKPAGIGEPGRMDPSTTKPPAPSVAVALELLAAQHWDAARVALSALAAQAPESKHVKALAAFAVGRQAQMEKRYDEARIELQRALMLDPDLAAAKAALGELFARRK